MADISKKYEIDMENGYIDGGASGNVYKARNKLVNTWCAVKIIKTDATEADIDSNKISTYELAENEAEILVGVSHPNIMKVYE